MLIGFKDTDIVELYDSSKKYKGSEKIERIIIPEVTTKEVYNQFMNVYLFDSKYLKTIIWNGIFDLSKFGITKLGCYDLSGCGVPTHIDLSGFRTHSITDINNPFGACDDVESINLSNWDLSGISTKQNFYIDDADNIPNASEFKAYEMKRNTSYHDVFPTLFPYRLFRNDKFRKVFVKNCNMETKKIIENQLKYMLFKKEYITSMRGGVCHEWLSFVLESPFKWQYSEENEEFILIDKDAEYLKKIDDAMCSTLTYMLY